MRENEIEGKKFLITFPKKFLSSFNEGSPIEVIGNKVWKYFFSGEK
jgi:hypothetical protein